MLLVTYIPFGSGEANSGSVDHLKIVHTPEEFISAVNVDGFRHIVVQAHMNVSVTDARMPLLQLQLSTKSIQVYHYHIVLLPPTQLAPEPVCPCSGNMFCHAISAHWCP